MRISDWSSDVCSSDLAAQFQGIDEASELELAGIEIILPAADLGKVRIIDHHLGDGRAMDDRALFAFVLLRDLMDGEAFTAVETDGEIPVLPAHLAAISVEAHALRLGDVDWLNMEVTGWG